MKRNNWFPGTGPVVFVAWVSLAWVSAAWCSAGAAEAQSHRYTRRNKLAISVTQTAKTKALSPRAKAKAKKLRPTITADAFIAVQRSVAPLRRAQIRQFAALILATDADHPDLPDLHFRLAELHARQQRHWRFRGMELYRKIANAKSRSARTSLKRQQARMFKTAQRHLLDAMKSYRALLGNSAFANYARMPEALFYYAHSLQHATVANRATQAQLRAHARTVYKRLISDYPQSKFIPQAYLAFADYFFEQSSMANAEKFYDKVLLFPTSRAWTYALYKKGWVYLNQKRYKLALAAFFDVVNKTRGIKRLGSIHSAAKKDYVRAYAAVGAAQMAYFAFRRVDRKQSIDMLRALGDVYLDQGSVTKAIYTFRDLMKRRPRHPRVCDWQYNVVHAMLSAPVAISKKVVEIENLVNLYGALRRGNAQAKVNVSECADNARIVTSEMAKVWHVEANTISSTATLAYVERLYRLYLKTFVSARDAGEIQYYLAELTWQRADGNKRRRHASRLWEKAAVGFSAVVKSGNVKGARLEESAYAAVLAWKNALSVDPKTNSPAASSLQHNPIPKPRSIPVRRRKMIAAFDAYLRHVKKPAHGERAMMKFLKARVYWRYDHLAAAVTLFADIVKNHPGHETSLYAANLLLDSLNRAQRHPEMISWVDVMLGNKTWLQGKTQLAAMLATLKVHALRIEARELEKHGKHIACAKAYVDIYNRNPTAKGNDEVLYNAGVCFESGKSIGAAIAVLTILSRRYPDSVAAKKAIARLGRNYARIAWYDRAASKFEEYAGRFAGAEGAADVLGEAVLYRKGLGSDKRAIQDTRRFIATFGRNKKHAATAADAFFGLTSIYEKRDNDDMVVSHLRAYLRRYAKTGGVERQVVAYSKIGAILWRKSCKTTRGVLGACVRIKRSRVSLGRKLRRNVRRDLSRRNATRVRMPTQCGSASKIKLVVVARDRRLARAARAAFHAATRAYNRGTASRGTAANVNRGRAASMDKYYAQAEFYLAEQDYERFLGLRFPAELDFDPKNKLRRRRSIKRFTAYINNKTAMMAALVRAPGAQPAGKYRRIVDFKGAAAHWSIAAAARIGQTSQNFSDALFTASIPKSVRTGPHAADKVDAYCDELTSRATPLERVSVGGYRFCLQKSTQRSWFNRWSRLCERELGQIRPQEFPSAAELRAMSDRLAPITDTELAVVSLSDRV